MIKVCGVCGKSFKGKSNLKYCCRECRAIGVGKNRRRVCDVCSKIFEGAINRTYCCKECARVAYKIHQVRYLKKYRKRPYAVGLKKC